MTTPNEVEQHKMYFVNFVGQNRLYRCDCGEEMIASNTRSANTSHRLILKEKESKANEVEQLPVDGIAPNQEALDRWDNATREPGKLDMKTKNLLRKIFTLGQAERYIHIVELRNKGLSFREIAKERGCGVSSVHMAYRRVVSIFNDFKEYFDIKKSISQAKEEATRNALNRVSNYFQEFGSVKTRKYVQQDLEALTKQPKE